MSRPLVSPAEASTVLALLDAATMHAPGSEAAFIRAYCVARSADPIDASLDRLRNHTDRVTAAARREPA